jgi:glycosyltransferase involved in cell wall biosynthesis
VHPEYLSRINKFIQKDPIRPIREALDVARLANRASKGAVLFVTHSLGGGAEQHVQDMAKLLELHGTAVFFCRVAPRDPQCLQIQDPGSPLTPNLPTFEVSRDVHRFACTLAAIGVRHIHVHHLADMPDSAPDFIRNVAKVADLAYDVTLHDYIAICPRIVLVDRSGVYCGEPPLHVCEDCVRRDGSPFGFPSVWEWRERYARLLSGARRVFVPDTDMITRLRRYHPAVNFILRPHPNPYALATADRSASRGSSPKSDRRRVAVIGAISKEKGSDLLLATARFAKSRRLPIDFVVVGYTDRDDDLKGLGKVEITGPYALNKAVDCLVATKPDVVWFPAVWPEAFSYTLSAVFAAGIFAIAFDIGALGSRIKAAGAGSLWPMEAMLDPARLAEMLLEEPILQTPVRRENPDYGSPLVSYYDLHTLTSY